MSCQTCSRQRAYRFRTGDAALKEDVSCMPGTHAGKGQSALCAPSWRVVSAECSYQTAALLHAWVMHMILSSMCMLAQAFAVNSATPTAMRKDTPEALQLQEHSMWWWGEGRGRSRQGGMQGRQMSRAPSPTQGNSPCLLGNFGGQGMLCERSALQYGERLGAFSRMSP